MSNRGENTILNGEWTASVLGPLKSDRDSFNPHDQQQLECGRAIAVASPMRHKMTSWQKVIKQKTVKNSVDLQLVILTTMTEGACVTNKDNIIVYTNPAFDRMFGYNCGELKGQPFNILRDYTFEQQIRLDEAWNATLREEGGWVGEVFNRKKDGTRFITSVHLTVINIGKESFRVLVQTDITKLRQAEAHRMQLLRQLNAAQEAERGRLARELHDQMGQDLTALTLGLRSLKKRIAANSEALLQLKQLQELAQQLSQQVHDLALELRPLVLDDLGLRMALLTLFERWSVHSGVKVKFQSPSLDKRLPSAVETGLYRIIQEALTNVAKHADANIVEVILEQRQNELRAVIRDNGKGFDTIEVCDLPETLNNVNKRLGLLGMRERVTLIGGTLKIQSIPKQGTTLIVRLPTSSHAGCATGIRSNTHKIGSRH